MVGFELGLREMALISWVYTLLPPLLEETRLFYSCSYRSLFGARFSHDSYTLLTLMPEAFYIDICSIRNKFFYNVDLFA